MKYNFMVFCVLFSFVVLVNSAVVYAQETAIPTTHRLMLNGQITPIAGYNIRGVNYFRLRDLAYALNGTAAQFNVTWDEAARAVRLYTNTPYSPAGGELQYSPTGAATAIIADTTFYVDGNEMNLLYGGGGISVGGALTRSIDDNELHPLIANIDGSNFVQLRLIGDLVGFYVGFIHEEHTILLNTNEMRDHHNNLNTAQRFLQNFLETGVTEMYYMALDANGNLWGWWNNLYTHLSQWRGRHMPRTQTQPDIIMENVIDFASSSRGGYAFAVTADNILWGWGFNEYGSLGDGTTENRFEPVKIMEDVVYVDTNDTFFPIKSTIAIKTDGSLWEWGTTGGWSITGAFVGEYRQAQKVMDNVVFASTGSRYNMTNMAITSDGVLWGWGRSVDEFFGEETRPSTRENPLRIMDDVIHVSTDRAAEIPTFAVIRSDNSLWTWGANNRGQLFDETTTNRREPMRVMDNVVLVNVQRSTHVIRSDGSLWNADAWDNELGEIVPVNTRVLENILWSTDYDGGDGYGRWVITTDGSLRRADIRLSKSSHDGIITNNSTVGDVFLPNIVSASLVSERIVLHRLPEQS
jgi:hypothetical protein